MTAEANLSLSIDWRFGWDAALAEARASRRPVLIDVFKDP
jgi:hypothetical protein